VSGEDWLAKIQSQVFSNTVGDKQIVELTPDQMKEQYKKSGSKKTFSEWAKSTGKDTLMALGALAGAILAGREAGKGTGKIESDKTDTGTPKPPAEEATILGMHPVTFGVVAVVTLVAIGFFAFRNKGSK
jgi:hypothetical protein